MQTTSPTTTVRIASVSNRRSFTLPASNGVLQSFLTVLVRSLSAWGV